MKKTSLTKKDIISIMVSMDMADSCIDNEGDSCSKEIQRLNKKLMKMRDEVQK